FRTGREQCDGGRTVAVGQEVAPPADVIELLCTAYEVRQVLARQQQARRAIESFDRGLPCHLGLDGIARTPDRAVGDQAQAAGLLHRLVRRTVFAEHDAVVREH